MRIENNRDTEKSQEHNIEKNENKEEIKGSFDKRLNNIEERLKPPGENKLYDREVKPKELDKELEKSENKEKKQDNFEKRLSNIEDSLTPNRNNKADNQNEIKQKIEKIRCINEGYEGKEHPKTGIKYERCTVRDSEGNLKEGVFPKFKSEFDAKLSPDEYKSTDPVQFNRANKQLKEAVVNDSDLAKKFTNQQLEMIEYGRTPRGYTWHHSEKLGTLQLVDTKVHDETRHTGGRKIWGGGTENR